MDKLVNTHEIYAENQTIESLERKDVLHEAVMCSHSHRLVDHDNVVHRGCGGGVLDEFRHHGL